MTGSLLRRLGAQALRVVMVLAIIAMTVWTGAVGCLWVNESRLVFSAGRSRIISPVNYDELIQLTTSDGVRPTLELAEVGFQPHRCVQVTPVPGKPTRVTFHQLQLGPKPGEVAAARVLAEVEPDPVEGRVEPEAREGDRV